MSGHERDGAVRPVLLCSSLTAGGSAKATLRLLRGLRNNGVEAYLLCPQRSTGEAGVVGMFGALERFMAMTVKGSEISLRALYRGRRDVPFTSAWIGCRIGKRLRGLQANVLHLNQCHNGFLDMNVLQRYRWPAVWTVHDWWPITGGCHFPGECERHRTGCGRCPALGSRHLLDLSWLNLRAKTRAWRKSQMALVAVSNAIRTSIEASPLFAGRSVAVIPNGLDLDVFRPLPKPVAREILRLPPEPTIMLFGAKRSDPNKGFATVEKLTQELGRSERAGDYMVVTFGDNAPINLANLGVKGHSFGQVEDDLKLALLYSAADLTLVSSGQESFGLVAAESMACGTPVLAYRTTGLVDIIDHRENGFLAEPHSMADYITGAKWILQELKEPERAGKIAASARAKVGAKFDIRHVASRYADLYCAATTGPQDHRTTGLRDH